MRGVKAAMLAVAFMVSCCVAVATPPIIPPVQYEQFCESQAISGTGAVEVITSVIDKRIALEYYNTMAGDGYLDMDQEQVYSQNADKVKREVSSVNDGNLANLNMYDNQKIIYTGTTPLTGGKYLRSKDFYGGMGNDIKELYSVNEMESDETTFFASTAPYDPTETVTTTIPCTPATCGSDATVYGSNVSNNATNSTSQIYPLVPTTASRSIAVSQENFAKDLKAAGRDQAAVVGLMGSLPTHVIGLETKNKFNGTWGTDATWHKIFYKDIKAHEMFTGKFEAQKTLKFHENPVPEYINVAACDGVDC